MLLAGVAMLLVGIITIAAASHYIPTHIPKEIIPDLRAAISARGVSDPDGRVEKMKNPAMTSLRVS